MSVECFAGAVIVVILQWDGRACLCSARMQQSTLLFNCVVGLCMPGTLPAKFDSRLCIESLQPDLLRASHAGRTKDGLLLRLRTAEEQLLATYRDEAATDLIQVCMLFACCPMC